MLTNFTGILAVLMQDGVLQLQWLQKEAKNCVIYLSRIILLNSTNLYVIFLASSRLWETLLSPVNIFLSDLWELVFLRLFSLYILYNISHAENTSDVTSANAATTHSVSNCYAVCIYFSPKEHKCFTDQAVDIIGTAVVSFIIQQLVADY